MSAITINLDHLQNVVSNIVHVNDGMQQLFIANEQITSASQQVSATAQELSNIAEETNLMVADFNT